MTTRWEFNDPITLAIYTVPINPNKMTSPHLAQNTEPAPVSPVDGRIRARRTRPLPREWSFGGVIRDQTHYDALLAWVEKPYPVFITDHLGRTWYVLLNEFAPEERRKNVAVPDRYTYEVKGYVLDGPT
jgi:hypothetical protein